MSFRPTTYQLDNTEEKGEKDMPEEPISRHEHDEFARRIDEENKRQNHRITNLEESLGKTHALMVSVEKLAANMESTLKEIEKQGQRLSALEERDGEKWRKVASYVITTVVGLIIGAVSSHIGL